MAYGRRRSRRSKIARIASRRAYRKAMRMPKRLVAKTYANAVGQIAFKSGRTRPSHGRRMRGMRRYGRRSYRRSRRSRIF